MYYYWLDLSLLYKGVLLILSGLAFGVVAYLSYISIKPTVSASNVPIMPFTLANKVALAFFLLCNVVVSNALVWQNEQILDKGQSFILELVPVDPRSLMQGDYMQLRYQAIYQAEITLEQHNPTDELPHQAYILLKQDPQGVAQFCRVDIDEPTDFGDCQPNLYFPFKPESNRYAGKQFFFDEQQAEHYQQAKYGEFRFKDGKVLLWRLLDQNRQPL